MRGQFLEFLAQPHQCRWPAAFQCSGHQSLLVEEEVTAMLEKEAIMPVSPDWIEFMSHLLVVPKKDGSLRPYIDLCALDTFVPYRHFKIEDVYLV